MIRAIIIGLWRALSLPLRTDHGRPANDVDKDTRDKLREFMGPGGDDPAGPPDDKA